VITSTTSPATTTAPTTVPTSGTTGNNLAAAAAAASQPGGPLGQDQFLQMLVAQLKNQDPLNPMQSDQMASELAQFSSLTQLQNINTTLTAQQASDGTLLGAVQSGAAIATIGHTVVATGNELEVGGANGSTSVLANVSANGASGTLTLYDANGNVVGSRSLGAVNAGKQSFNLGSAADGLAPGDYTYSINVKDASGNAVSVQTYMTGKVDGVSTSSNGLVLTSGDLAFPYANVVQILN